MSMYGPLEREAETVAQLLEKKKEKLVMVESCTGGMVASVLTLIPGVSKNFCGSLVVYRDTSKQSWLGLSKAFLTKNTDVSEATSEALALSALERTPEAGLALAVTGHLGPNAPAKEDGKCFIALAYSGKKKLKLEIPDSKMHRKNDCQILNHSLNLDESSFTLSLSHMTRNSINKDSGNITLRHDRQLIASFESLSMVRQLLEQLK